MVYYCRSFTGIVVAYRLLICVFCVTAGPRMYPVVFGHSTIVVNWFSPMRSSFLLCTVIVHCKTFVTPFIGFFYVYLSLPFDMRTAIFTLRATWWLVSRSVLLSQMYSTAVCVGSCLTGEVAVVMSWGGSVFATRFGRVFVGAGWDGLFVAGGVLVRHRKFCWGLC